MFQALNLCLLCLYLGVEIYLIYSHIFQPEFVKYNSNYTSYANYNWEYMNKSREKYMNPSLQPPLPTVMFSTASSAGVIFSFLSQR